MKTTKTIITLSIIALAIVALIILGTLLGRQPENEDFITGNTAGNLYNKGLFCQSEDGTVYFSNPYDDNVMYSMNADKTNIKKLTNVGVESINCDGKRLFYYQSNTAKGSGLGYVRTTTGVYRSNLNGDRSVCLKRDPAGIVALCGNHLFYQHYTKETGTTLDKLHIDKKDESVLLNEAVNPANIHNGIIYYAGVNEDHYLYAMDTQTGNISLVWEHNLHHPIYHEGHIYFMDLETDYELHRYDLASGLEEVISTDRLDYFNIYGDVIFFQKSSPQGPALKRIRLNGSNEEVIMQGTFSEVNITSDYAYFREFGKPTPIYHQSTYGVADVSVFDPMMLK